MRFPLIASAVLLTGAAPPTVPAAADAFIRDTLHMTRFRATAVDLDGDGKPEVLVHDDDQQACGSGGCDLDVLTPAGPSYRLVTTVSITRAPIWVLATRSHGWRDLGVLVAGGGIISGYEARLRYDGRGYPENPTVPPATRLARPNGRVVIR